MATPPSNPAEALLQRMSTCSDPLSLPDETYFIQQNSLTAKGARHRRCQLYDHRALSLPLGKNRGALSRRESVTCESTPGKNKYNFQSK
jgi:hypothetical protein